MKFVELKKHLLSGNFYHCYNIYGDDSFLVDSSKKLFFTYASSQNEFDKAILSAENFNENNVFAILNTPSFFGTKKTVVLTGVEKQKNKDIAKFIEEYLKSPNPETIFLIISDELLFDETKNPEHLCGIDCNKLDRSMLVRWIKNNAAENNAQIADDAITTLIDYTNEYLSRISLEMNKLISYSNGNITKHDIELLVTKELEYSVFELTENLGRGNSEKTFEILNQMMNDKKAAPAILSHIQSFFRRIFFCAITPKTNAQVAAELGVKEYAVKKAKEVATLFSKMALKDIVQECANIDAKVKSGQTNYQNAVQFLVMYILINNKKMH